LKELTTGLFQPTRRFFKASKEKGSYIHQQEIQNQVQRHTPKTPATWKAEMVGCRFKV
jgi:hypothetical protein